MSRPSCVVTVTARPLAAGLEDRRRPDHQIGNQLLDDNHADGEFLKVRSPDTRENLPHHVAEQDENHHMWQIGLGPEPTLPAKPASVVPPLRLLRTRLICIENCWARVSALSLRHFDDIPRLPEKSKNPLANRRDSDSTVGMVCRGFLDAESRKDLTELARDGSAAHRLARRANALVLLDDGMSCEAIAKVLLLDDDTIRTWYRLYEEDGIEGLASFGYEGSACRLSAEQQDKLKTWIIETLPRTTREVGAWIEKGRMRGSKHPGPVWPDRAVAPPWHGTSQTKDGVAQARSRETGRVHQGV